MNRQVCIYMGCNNYIIFYLSVQRLDFSFGLNSEVYADFRNVKMWENVHFGVTLATGRDWGMEAIGGQGRRKVANMEFDIFAINHKT